MNWGVVDTCTTIQVRLGIFFGGVLIVLLGICDFLFLFKFLFRLNEIVFILILIFSHLLGRI